MIDLTYQEALELENSFGTASEHYDQGGRHYLVTVANGDHCEAHELKRNPDTGKLEVHSGDDFDWAAV